MAEQPRGVPSAPLPPNHAILTPEMIRPHVIAAVQRKRDLMWRFRDSVGEDDLIQICMHEVMACRSPFNPAKGKLSTYVSRICQCRIIDVARAQSRRLLPKSGIDSHEAGDEIPSSKEAAKSILEALCAQEGKHQDMPIIEFVRRVYAAACKLPAPKEPRRQKHWLTHAQRITIAAIKIKRPTASEENIRLIMDANGQAVGRVMKLKQTPTNTCIKICLERDSCYPANNSLRMNYLTRKKQVEYVEKYGEWLWEWQAAVRSGLSSRHLSRARREGNPIIPYYRTVSGPRYKQSDIDEYLRSAKVVKTQQRLSCEDSAHAKS